MAWNLKKLEHFVAVAKSESLSGAARAIGMSQPALTSSIRGLEKDLGFELFDRDEGFVLTGLGREFLPRAEEALEKVGDLEREVELVRSGESGELRIACGPVVSDGVLGDALAGMLGGSGREVIHVRVTPVTDFVDILKSREVDLVVGEEPALAGDPEIKLIRLAPHPVVFFVRKGHPLANKRRITNQEFFSYPLLGPELARPIVGWLESQRPEGVGAPGLTLTCSHFGLLKRVVAGSDAISGAPRAVIEPELERGQFVLLRFGKEGIFNRPAVAYLRNRPPSPLALRLIEALRQTDP